MANDKIRICPRCGKEYSDYPALSRRDNETLICPACGVDEAFEDFYKAQHRKEVEKV